MKIAVWGILLMGLSWGAAPFSAPDFALVIKTKLQDKVPFSGDFDVHLSNSKLLVNHESDADQLDVDDVYLNTDQRGFQATVSVVKGDSRIKLNIITGKIDPLSDFPMLIRVITPGDEITESDISWQKMPSVRLTQNFILSKDDLVGKTARGRVLQPGQPISKNDVHYPIVIKRGDTVAVAYRTNNMMLTTAGLAEKDAAIGDPIRLKTAANTFIQAKVIGPNKAEIKPMEF